MRIQQKRYSSLPQVLIILMEYCWAVLVVLNGNSVYNANRERNYHLLLLSVLMTVILLCANIVLKGMTLKRRNFALAICLCIYSMFYCVVRRSHMQVTNYLYLFVAGLPTLVVLFAELHRRNRLIPMLCRLCNVVCVFAALSLFFWTFGVVMEMIEPNMSTRIAWGTFDWIQGFYGLHFIIQRETTFGTLMYRNTGIFTEGPMLNLWVCIAMAIELFLRKKPSRTKITILAITVFTTMSTTGFIYLLLCVFLKYYEKLKNADSRTKILLLLAGLMLVPLLVYLVYMLLEEKSDTQSFAMRMSDYVGGLRLWLDHPVFGSGYANLESLLDYIYSPSGVVGFSNSIMAVLSTGGLWMAAVFLIPHIGAMFPKWTMSRNFSRFAICYFFLFCTTAYFARYMAVVLLAAEIAVLLERKNNAAIAA